MVLFDTDVLVWFFRGHDGAAKLLSATPYHERCVSSLCLMELIQGCRDRKERKDVKAFMRDNFAGMVHADERISTKAIDLLELHALSDGLRTVDALIAASAIVHDAQLCTANWKHFKKIPRLSLVRFRP